MTTTYRKSYDAEYIRTKALEYYNEKVRADPERYAEKKKQIKEYMTNKYKMMKILGLSNLKDKRNIMKEKN
jgi:hypothetical protein